MFKDRIIVGLTEKVIIIGKKGKSKKIAARMDTGATKSSIDTKLADQLNLGPIIRSKLVKSAHGNSLRPVIEVEIKLNGNKIKEEYTLADRDHMKYKVLIGQNVLKKGFLIDPQK